MKFLYASVSGGGIQKIFLHEGVAHAHDTTEKNPPLAEKKPKLDKTKTTDTTKKAPGKIASKPPVDPKELYKNAQILRNQIYAKSGLNAKQSRQVIALMKNLKQSNDGKVIDQATLTELRNHAYRKLYELYENNVPANKKYVDPKRTTEQAIAAGIGNDKFRKLKDGIKKNFKFKDPKNPTPIETAQFEQELQARASLLFKVEQKRKALSEEYSLFSDPKAQKRFEQYQQKLFSGEDIKITGFKKGSPDAKQFEKDMAELNALGPYVSTDLANAFGEKGVPTASLSPQDQNERNNLLTVLEAVKEKYGEGGTLTQPEEFSDDFVQITDLANAGKKTEATAKFDTMLKSSSRWHTQDLFGNETGKTHDRLLNQSSQFTKGLINPKTGQRHTMQEIIADPKLTVIALRALGSPEKAGEITVNEFSKNLNALSTKKTLSPAIQEVQKNAKSLMQELPERKPGESENQYLSRLNDPKKIAAYQNKKNTNRQFNKFMDDLKTENPVRYQLYLQNRKTIIKEFGSQKATATALKNRIEEKGDKGLGELGKIYKQMEGIGRDLLSDKTNQAIDDTVAGLLIGGAALKIGGVAFSALKGSFALAGARFVGQTKIIKGGTTIPALQSARKGQKLLTARGGITPGKNNTITVNSAGVARKSPGPSNALVPLGKRNLVAARKNAITLKPTTTAARTSKIPSIIGGGIAAATVIGGAALASKSGSSEQDQSTEGTPASSTPGITISDTPGVNIGSIANTVVANRKIPHTAKPKIIAPPKPKKAEITTTKNPEKTRAQTIEESLFLAAIKKGELNDNAKKGIAEVQKFLDGQGGYKPGDWKKITKILGETVLGIPKEDLAKMNDAAIKAVGKRIQAAIGHTDKRGKVDLSRDGKIGPRTLASLNRKLYKSTFKKSFTPQRIASTLADKSLQRKLSKARNPKQRKQILSKALAGHNEALKKQMKDPKFTDALMRHVQQTVAPKGKANSKAFKDGIIGRQTVAAMKAYQAPKAAQKTKQKGEIILTDRHGNELSPLTNTTGIKFINTAEPLPNGIRAVSVTIPGGSGKPSIKTTAYISHENFKKYNDGKLAKNPKSTTKATLPPNVKIIDKKTKIIQITNPKTKEESLLAAGFKDVDGKSGLTIEPGTEILQPKKVKKPKNTVKGKIAVNPVFKSPKGETQVMKQVFYVTPEYFNSFKK